MVSSIIFASRTMALKRLKRTHMKEHSAEGDAFQNNCRGGDGARSSAQAFKIYVHMRSVVKICKGAHFPQSQPYHS